MNRLKLLSLFVSAITLFGLALASDAGGGIKGSDSKVKASAKASKIDAKGEQTVTITLDIEKGWHLYANPVNHNKELLDANRTRLKVSAKATVGATVRYPAGKTHVDKDEKYDIYEGIIKIEAKVKRSAGDTSPLELVIDVNACNDSICLPPGKVKLTVP